MIGAGTVINPLIKIVTTFAILGAVYLFIVKPTLETTEHISDGINQQINSAFGGLDQNQKQRVSRTLKKSKIKAEQVSVSGSISANQQLKIANCINRVAPDTAKIQRCLK